MSLAGIMIFGIAAALAAVLLKQIKSEYSIFLVTGAAIILFLVVLSQIGTVIETIQKIQKLIYFDDVYINILVKITGISYLTQFAADICKDCGYQSLAGQLQIFGKISVLAVSMPVVMALLEMVNQLLE